jgi:hypothetical protein
MTNSNLCVCEGFHYRKKCRHVLEALLSLTKKELKILTEEVDYSLLDWTPTALEGLNELTSIPGNKNARGLPAALPIAFYGFHESLKSSVGTQLGAGHSIERGTNALFMDTEGAQARYGIPYWTDILSKRFEHKLGVQQLKFLGGELQDYRTYSKGNPIMYTLRETNLMRILKLHGVDILYKISEPANPEKTQSKIILDLKSFEMDVEQSPIGKFISENNIGFIMYDSISMPIQKSFIGSRQNKPVRTEATHAWLGQVHTLADLFDLVVIGTVHASGDPQAFTGKPGSLQRPNPLGGAAILHNFKKVIFLQGIDTMKSKNIKKMWIERSPWKSAWEEHHRIKMTDAGVIDAPPEK